MSVWRKGLAPWILVMLLATPLPAAAGDIWDIIAYIHELSGPGPFHHAGGPLGIYGFEVFCRDDDGSPSPVCTTERKDVRFYALLELGWLNDKPRDDNPIRFDGNVFLRTYQLVAYVPGQKIAGLRSIPGLANGLDLGAGFGLYHFTGAAVTEESLWRISIPLRARFTPSEFWANSDYLQRRRSTAAARAAALGYLSGGLRHTAAILQQSRLPRPRDLRAIGPRALDQRARRRRVRGGRRVQALAVSISTCLRPRR